ncbi:GlsB/YeaQ/YmgE family stress response membrane protein [Patescibacteria group bacterium]|nr:GlsB/YeaQ/YmgE family stress response membrane protein [Patescibacteria group bacterium]
MGIILWIVFGAIVGWVASLIMKTRGGIVMDIIVGIVGAVIGGWAMSFFGGAPVGGFNLYSFVVALIGAVILLAIVKAVSGKRSALV